MAIIRWGSLIWKNLLETVQFAPVTVCRSSESCPSLNIKGFGWRFRLENEEVRDATSSSTLNKSSFRFLPSDTATKRFGETHVADKHTCWTAGSTLCPSAHYRNLLNKLALIMREIAPESNVGRCRVGAEAKHLHSGLAACCAKTVSESARLRTLDPRFERKQDPQVVVFLRSSRNQKKPTELAIVLARQALQPAKLTAPFARSISLTEPLPGRRELCHKRAVRVDSLCAKSSLFNSKSKCFRAGFG